MVVKLVEKYGPKRWSLIASQLKGRIGKQCRERYDYIFWVNSCCGTCLLFRLLYFLLSTQSFNKNIFIIKVELFVPSLLGIFIVVLFQCYS